MAEALASIGLAANIAQFVGYGISIISDTREIYHSAYGAKDENVELEHVVTNVMDINEQIIRGASACSSRKLSPDEMALQNLAKDCQPLTEQLLSILQKLKPSDDAHFPELEALRKALRSTAKKREIEDLETRLHKIESQVSLRFMALFRRDQFQVLEAMRTLNDNALRLQSTLEQRFVGFSSELQWDMQSQRSEISASLSLALTQNKKAETEKNFLNRLGFDVIQKRYSQIEKAHRTTFEWMFENPEIRYLEWLMHGSGIFWPGSGKSTLMKYLFGHKTTQDALKKWAGSNHLVTASYFFWGVGTPLQKSHEGLLRSLLYQIFKFHPLLLNDICAQVNHGIQWTIEDLQNILHLTFTQGEEGTKFCLFIDGLDEYEGDAMDVLDYVQEMAAYSNVKICVSSRPWNAFQIAFGKSCFKLRVETLTRKDLWVYVHDKLTNDILFQQVTRDKLDCEVLVSDITSKAEGVFLWVYLVVRNILRDLRDGEESYDDLRRRIDAFPTELNEYFRRILDDLDPLHREETARILLVLLVSGRGLQVQAFEGLALDMKEPGHAMSQEILPLDVNHFRSLAQRWQKRLGNRGKDLLSIHSDWRLPAEQRPYLTVDFLHKSVRDFLLENYHTELQSKAAPGFDPRTCLCHALLYIVKTKPRTFDWQGQEPAQMMSYIRSFDNEKDPLGMILLDEVDRVMSVYPSGKSSWALGIIAGETGKPILRKLLQDGNSEELLVDRMPEDLLLIFAAMEGLLHYLDHNIDQRPSSPEESLHDRLSISVLGLKTISPGSYPRKLLSVAKLLLQKGANPNQRLNMLDGFTIWTCFLLWEFWYRVLGFRTRESVETCHILLLMIDHGADLDIRFDREAATSSTKTHRGWHNLDENEKIAETHIPETLSEMFSTILIPEDAQRLQAKIDEITLRKLADSNAPALESPSLYVRAQGAVARASHQLMDLGSRFSGLGFGPSTSSGP